MKLSLKEKELLEEYLYILSKLTEAFKASVKHIEKINLDEIYNFDDWEPVDAFFDRFERLVDFLFQRIFRFIFRMENRTDPISLVELTTFITKKWFAKSNDFLIEVKDLRNKIAHEYIWIGVYYNDEFIQEIISYFTRLEFTIDAVKNYLEEIRWN